MIFQSIGSLELRAVEGVCSNSSIWNVKHQVTCTAVYNARAPPNLLSLHFRLDLLESRDSLLVSHDPHSSLGWAQV